MIRASAFLIPVIAVGGSMLALYAGGVAASVGFLVGLVTGAILGVGTLMAAELDR